MISLIVPFVVGMLSMLLFIYLADKLIMALIKFLK